MARKLPSLYALRVFEVAGRLQNFTRAASELNLTQGAVSYQIGLLEFDLGFPLFKRVGRSVVMSSHGVALWPVLHSSFDQIVEVIDRLKRQARQHPQEVAVAATTYFASRWLLRRLAHFMTAYPTVGVRIQYAPASERDVSDVPLEIRWGDGDWPGLKTTPLFSTELMGLCSPALLSGKIGPLTGDDIKHIPHLRDEGPKEAEAWRQWLELAGVRQPSRVAATVIADPNVRMQAAVDGQGFVLADRLAQEELHSGRLVAPVDITLSGYSYYVVRRNPILSEPEQLFADWLHEEASRAF